MFLLKSTTLLILIVFSFNTYSQNITLEEIEFGGLTQGVALSCFGLYDANGDFEELEPFSKIYTTIKTTRKILNNTEKKLWVEFSNASSNDFKTLKLSEKIKACKRLIELFPSSTKEE